MAGGSVPVDPPTGISTMKGMNMNWKILRRLALGSLAVTFLLAAASCGEAEQAQSADWATDESDHDAGTEVDFSGELNVVGSTTVQPLAERLAEGFEAMHHDLIIFVQGGGSSVGVRSAADGSADVGMASRHVKQSELVENPQLVVHTIARDGIAIVTEPAVGVTELSLEQVRDIFSGSITDWREVGGEAQMITVVAREEGSGTRAAFEELVMGDDALITDQAILQPSNGAVRTTVSVTPGAIAFLSFGYLDETTSPIAVDGVLPTEENAAADAYKVVRPLNMITLGTPEGAAAAWLEFIMSVDGQAIVTSEGYLSVN